MKPGKMTYWILLWDHHAAVCNHSSAYSNLFVTDVAGRQVPVVNGGYTAHMESEDTLMLTDQQGRYLTCRQKGGLTLTAQAAEHDCSVWQLIPSKPGYYLKSVGAENEQAIENFNERIGTFSLDGGENFLFNFYELQI